jgi:hypothetical protein
MAITNNGTLNNAPEAKLPTGYSRPSVTTFTDWLWKADMTLTVAKGTVENANPVTTMTNIITNGTVGVTKQVDDILAADFLGTATVTAYAEILDISTNYRDETGSEVWLDNIAADYEVTVRVYVKAV